MRKPLPKSLDECGDVLDDRELASVNGASLLWPRNERYRAKQLGLTPNLPPAMPGFKRPRYRKVAVAQWMESGSRARRALGRAS